MNSNQLTDVTNTPNNFKFETGIGPMTDRILNSVLDRVTSGNFKEKLTDKIVDPVMLSINNKIRPYVYTGIILYAILVILLIVIIYLLVKKNKKIV